MIYPQHVERVIGQGRKGRRSCCDIHTFEAIEAPGLLLRPIGDMIVELPKCSTSMSGTKTARQSLLLEDRSFVAYC